MTEDWKMQVSPRTPSGTLINIRGNTVEELQQSIIEMYELASTIVGLEELLGAVHAVAPLSTGPSTGTQSAAPSSNTDFPSTPPTVTPAGNGNPTCIHGARGFKTGNKDGRTWTAWMCPTPKGTPNQCPPVWG